MPIQAQLGKGEGKAEKEPGMEFIKRAVYTLLRTAPGNCHYL
jgi:hypothetical protein